jgi:hypothetical protein
MAGLEDAKGLVGQRQELQVQAELEVAVGIISVAA